MRRYGLLSRGIVIALLIAALLAPAGARAAVPRRIVSLSPGITEILFALGLGERIAGDTRYCDYPPAARRKAHVGDVTPSYEAIVALRPDLIVLDAESNRQAVPRLRSLKLPLLIVGARSFASVEQSILTIGERGGERAAAARVVAAMEWKAARAARIGRMAGQPLHTLVVIGTNPLYVAGPDSFVGDMLRRAGGVNCVAAGSYSPYSKESAVAANPDAIFCSASDSALIRSDPAWSATTAVRSGNIFTVDTNLLFRPGPRLADGMIAVAQDLAKARR